MTLLNRPTNETSQHQNAERLPNRMSVISVAPDLRSFPDFESAASAVLEFLHAELGLGLWMVTRTDGDDWIILASRDAAEYAIADGDVLRWSDSFCSRMVSGVGPRVAPVAMDVPSYAAAPAAFDYDIGAYVGVPLTTVDGRLFGTLCAIDPAPQPASLEGAQGLLELCAQLLSTVLDREQRLVSEARAREEAEAKSYGDLLTGVLSRRGWERALALEEARSSRTGAPACVLVGDLDDLKQVNDEFGHARGDELLYFAGRLLASACRTHDRVARIGGDEFAILAPETDLTDGRALLSRVRSVLDAADIAISLGVARRNPAHGGLTAALEAADQDMLADKARRRAR